MNGTSISKDEVLFDSDENGFVLRKKVELSRNSFFADMQFSQKSWTHEDRQPQILLRKDLVQQNQMIRCCY